MKVLVRGDEIQFGQIKRKFAGLDLTHIADEAEKLDFNKYEAVFDFLNSDDVQFVSRYNSNPQLIVFCNTVFTSLASLRSQIGGEIDFRLIGFNGLNSFIDRPLLELTVLSNAEVSVVEDACTRLGTDYIIVDDKPGMVTPRVICMIINEAYFTLEEGTADKDSIDAAMKLGTNYPMGPFEWSKQIGLRSIVKLLESVFEETQDLRYSICPLLLEEAQNEIELFYRN